MRPVNLIPTEQRPGGRKPLRAGPLAYIVIGALAAAVIAITALVVTNDKVSDRKAEVATLESEKVSVEAKAHALASYSQFASVREQRLSTVTELADSRFDWERVLAELSLVLPADVQLTSLTGTVAPGVNVSGGSGIGMRTQIAGPALEMVGCASSQAAVAGFVEALKDIEDAGFDKLHMAFYKNQDIGNDGVWDVWQLEGPQMVWYFRGAPHVHVWVNVRDTTKA